MQVYRYNVENRELRSFNQTGREKNPNAVKFYATNLVYAEKYNSEDYECTLEVSNVDDSNLFDMNTNFTELSVYNAFIANKIGTQLRDYTRFMNEAKKVKERKMWEKQINDLKNREVELIEMLKVTEFQSLSDYELQNDLIAELKAKGFKGYFTNNEIAIF